jgi:uncharacterized protein (DUF362 family)
VSNDGLTRRELLARGAGAVVTAGLAGAAGYVLFDSRGDAGLRKPNAGGPRLRNYFADVDFPAGNPRVSVATGSENQVEQMIRTAIGGLAPAVGIKQFIKPGDIVLIKPNVGFDRPPHLGATTNPDVLRGVLRLCKEAGARRLIVADNPIEAPEACFAKSKVAAVAAAEGAGVAMPNQSDFITMTIRERPPDAGRGEALQNWPVLYRPLMDVTKVIGVTPIKDHNLCSASMTMKNWYGLLGGRRNQFHQAIHHIVSDLGMMMSATLVIGDATRVMMNNGPTGGRISDIKVGGELGKPAIVAAVDPVACDAWCYRHLLGRDPAQLAYLELAQRKIAAQVADGWKRYGDRDWQALERQGKIVVTGV